MQIIRNRKVVRVIGLFLLFTIVYGIRNAGTYLVINEAPQKADAIIVLSGVENRIQKGIELYKQKYAPYLILSNANEDNMDAYIIARNVPKRSVFFETNADSTYKNALYTKEMMTKHHLKSAIIVTSTFHTRRTKVNNPHQV